MGKGSDEFRISLTLVAWVAQIENPVPVHALWLLANRRPYCRDISLPIFAVYRVILERWGHAIRVVGFEFEQSYSVLHHFQG